MTKRLVLDVSVAGGVVKTVARGRDRVVGGQYQGLVDYEPREEVKGYAPVGHCEWCDAGRERAALRTRRYRAGGKE